MSVKPTSQLSSRGLRNAPVKKMRAMWVTMDAVNTSADQWWTWRMSRPPGTSKDMNSVDSKALVMWTPCMVSSGPWYTTASIEGTKNAVRMMPESSSTMKEYSAISPSMNDQWSGNSLREKNLTKPPMLVRSSTQLAVFPATRAVRLGVVAGVVSMLT